MSTSRPKPKIVVAPPKPAVVVPPKPTPSTNVPAPAPTPPLLAPNDHLLPGETWTSLERWSVAAGYGPVKRVPNDVSPTYSFTSTNGTMIIHTGLEVASWRGFEFHLGFAPQIVGGHPYVHALDVRKNLLPLLEEPVRLTTNHVIVIDPGHGGTDTGTKNVANGHFEKEFTLDLARRLQAVLIADGWTALLSRSNDVYVALPSRVAFADQHKAALFLSLHFNSAFPDHQEAGLETFCVTPHGDTFDTDARLHGRSVAHVLEQQVRFRKHAMPAGAVASRGVEGERACGSRRAARAIPHGAAGPEPPGDFDGGRLSVESPRSKTGADL